MSSGLIIERPVWELLRKENLLTPLIQKPLQKGPMIAFLLAHGHEKKVKSRKRPELIQLIASEYVNQRTPQVDLSIVRHLVNHASMNSLQAVAAQSLAVVSVPNAEGVHQVPLNTFHIFRHSSTSKFSSFTPCSGCLWPRSRAARCGTSHHRCSI
jgi:hypothetical protein